MSERVAVIGASSFYGGYFAKYLEEKGHAVSRFSRRDGTGDFRRADTLARDIMAAEPRYVVNFAALNMVGESWDHSGDYYQTNVADFARVVRGLCERGGLERFVEVSTPEVYGALRAQLREDTPYNPSTPYAVSRAARDMHLTLMHKQHGFPVVFSRTVNIYGPEQQLYRIVPRTIAACMTGRKLKLQGGGQSYRSFIHVHDACDGVYAAMLSGRVGECYHTSVTRQVKIVDLVTMIAGMHGLALEDVAELAPERPGKDPVYFLDSGKARYELGWRDTIDLEEGLWQVANWMQHEYTRERLMAADLDYTHKG